MAQDGEKGHGEAGMDIGVDLGAEGDMFGFKFSGLKGEPDIGGPEDENEFVVAEFGDFGEEDKGGDKAADHA